MKEAKGCLHILDRAADSPTNSSPNMQDAAVQGHIQSNGRGPGGSILASRRRRVGPGTPSDLSAFAGGLLPRFNAYKNPAGSRLRRSVTRLDSQREHTLCARSC